MEDRRGIEWGNNNALAAWASKLLGMTARLAGILTLLKEPNSTCVDSTEYYAAQRIMEEYFIPHMRYAFCGDQQISEPAKVLLDAMIAIMTREQKCARHSKVWERIGKKPPFNKPNRDKLFDQALNELAAAGMIRKVELERAATGRPSKGAWEVNPKLLINVPALQPKRIGNELNKYFPDYSAPTKSFEALLEEQQWEKEAEANEGLPF